MKAPRSGENCEKRVLVIDDVPDFLHLMSRILRPYFHVSVCSSPLRAIRLANSGKFDLVLTTLVMKETDGFDVIRRIRGSGCMTPIIMITGHGNDSTAIEAIRLGASDYLTKPVAPDELIARIRKALGRPSATETPETVVKSDVITRNPEMRSLLNLAVKVAKSNSRVLLLGETGTGKEVIARLLHSNSSRSQEPFVEVNCASIPHDLLESEFFGHEKGSFTGAYQSRRGRFEEASNGTLFLDEIGELSMSLQSKLLRALQSGNFTRIGGMHVLHSNARIVAATNRDLEEEVRAGRFRADLFYRLNVVTLKLPPLRRRKEDLPLLVEHFARHFAASPRDRISFPSTIMKMLVEYSWPGNIRELEHMIERLSVLYPGQSIGPEMVADQLRDAMQLEERPSLSLPTLTYKQALTEFQKNYYQRVISSASGNLAEAARIAGVDRSHFFRKAKSLGFAETP